MVAKGVGRKPTTNKERTRWIFPYCTSDETGFGIVDLTTQEIDATAGGMRYVALIWRGLDYAGRLFTAAEIGKLTSVDLEDFGRRDAATSRPGGGV